MTDQQLRFFEIMRRHIRLEDDILSDEQFVRIVLSRWELERAVPLIDPNE